MGIQFLVPGRDLVLVAGPGVSMGPVVVEGYLRNTVRRREGITVCTPSFGYLQQLSG